MVEIQYNLGLLAGGDEAIAAFTRAVEGRPTFVLAWFHLGEAQQGEKAIAAYRRTEIDPTFTRAYLGIARALIARGDREEALRYLRHGAKVAVKRRGGLGAAGSAAVRRGWAFEPSPALLKRFIGRPAKTRLRFPRTSRASGGSRCALTFLLLSNTCRRWRATAGAVPCVGIFSSTPPLMSWSFPRSSRRRAGKMCTCSPWPG
jgi:hypothetical protein